MSIEPKLSERIERREVHWVEHFKGEFYLIYNVATHTETGRKVVLYAGGGKGLWCRPLTMFDDEVEVNGEIVPRFVEVQP